MEILNGVPTVFGGYNGKQQNEKLYQYNYKEDKWFAHPTIKLNTPRMSPAVFQVPKYLFDHIPCSNPDSDEEVPESTSCNTIATRDTGSKPCIFPFISEGKVYNGCGRRNDKYNCATRVDEEGNFLEFGECNPRCPKDIGTDSTCMTKRTRDSEPQPCIFPFITEDGQEHDTCTQIDGKLQCATKLDRDGILQESGECDVGCPKQMCMTKGTRDSAAQPCIFPFITEDGQEHDSCTQIDGKFQCATKLDRDGILQESGECDVRCPKQMCMTKGRNIS